VVLLALAVLGASANAAEANPESTGLVIDRRREDHRCLKKAASLRNNGCA
jgi:hypothetical protein